MPCFTSWPIRQGTLTWEQSPARTHAVLAGYVPEKTHNPQVDTSIVYNPDYDNDFYYNLGQRALRWKFVQLSTMNLLVHSLGCVGTIVHDLFHIVTFTYFLKDDVESGERCSLVGRILLHLIFAPILVVALQCIAMVGICHTGIGRKYTIFFETLLYGTTLAAPRFGIGPYRPLYDCLTIPFYPCQVVDKYESHCRQVRAGGPPIDIFDQG